jgi:hypothetical protein
VIHDIRIGARFLFPACHGLGGKEVTPLEFCKDDIALRKIGGAVPTGEQFGFGKGSKRACDCSHLFYPLRASNRCTH